MSGHKSIAKNMDQKSPLYPFFMVPPLIGIMKELEYIKHKGLEAMGSIEIF